MFHRLFGSRKSPVTEGVEGSDAAVEATEKPDEICNDGFVVIGDPSPGGDELTLPQGYTMQAANAFLPYSLHPQPAPTCNRSLSAEGVTAIDGIPFKFGSSVLLEESVLPVSTASVTEMLTKIKTFNWDDYEYSFELEKSIMREFNSTHYTQT